MSMLNELYQEMIVDHGKSPRSTGMLSSATHSMVGHNPLCGDKLTLYLIVKNDVIEETRFEGEGCAISIASTSLMLEWIKGKSINEIEAFIPQFRTLVLEGKGNQEQLGKLMAFSGVHHYPIRVKCATLPWHTLHAALNQKQITVTTE